MKHEYRIARAHSIVSLEDLVENLLGTGWHLVGGVSYADTYWVQAVTRSIDPPEEKLLSSFFEKRFEVRNVETNAS